MIMVHYSFPADEVKLEYTKSAEAVAARGRFGGGGGEEFTVASVYVNHWDD